MVLEKKEQFKEAELAMQQALGVNPAYADVYFSLGVLYADHLNEPQKSVDAFRRYMELGGRVKRIRILRRELNCRTRRGQRFLQIGQYFQPHITFQDIGISE